MTLHSSFIIRYSSLLLTIPLLLSCTSNKQPARPIHDSPPQILQAPGLELPNMETPPQQNAIFQVLVQPSGKPSDIKLTQSSGVPEIDARCRSSIDHYKFRPAYSNGKPIAATMNVTFNFQLGK